MKTNDISTAFISWPGGGKRRPIYIISDVDNKVRFYPNIARIPPLL